MDRAAPFTVRLDAVPLKLELTRAGPAPYGAPLDPRAGDDSVEVTVPPRDIRLMIALE